MIRYAALLIGICIVGLGVLGLAAPETFIAALHYFQRDNHVYLAMALRLLVAAIVYFSAPDTRFPKSVRAVGVMVALLGLLTPILHRPLPLFVLGEATKLNVRPWAIFSILVGLFLIVASAPPRELED